MNRTKIEDVKHNEGELWLGREMDDQRLRWRVVLVSWVLCVGDYLHEKARLM
ncbi:uncharacterized protein G2W53_042662 [Senna tora]|uniref:Uncharacterized protein n=1 Tax=Senna tora TaxID=362788 RepID=A0A834SHA6_9FABA|nr:uncharacterized protein G2W53_042662 [Senna tora]